MFLKVKKKSFKKSRISIFDNLARNLENYEKFLENNF